MKYTYISAVSVLAIIGVLSLAPIAMADDVTPAIDSSSLSQTYDGSSKPVTLNPNPLPNGYTAAVTYEGDTIAVGVLPHYGPSPTAPTDAGTYTVTVNVTGPNNYTDTVPGVLVINQAPLTFTVDDQHIQYGNTPMTYPYDSQTPNVYECASIHLDGLKGGDQITTASCLSDYGNGAAITANAAPGTYPIALSDMYPLNSTELSNNYHIKWVLGTMTITPRTLTVSGITAADKTYDGTVDASVDVSGAVLNGTVNGDNVSLNTSGTVTGAFNDANIGTGKTVTISGLAITGADASKYVLAAATTTADINQTVSTSSTPSSSSSSSGSYYGGGSFTPIAYGLLDFNILMANWGKISSNLPGDLNHDGTVNILDFNILMAYWAH